MAEQNPLNSLPQEITLNIFSRLPGQSVLDCKLVCRAWRNLLQIHAKTAYFAYQHLHQQHGHSPHGSVAFDREAEAFWYLEYHDDGDRITDKQPNYCIKTININFPADMCVGQGLVGSNNGLICLSLETRHNGIRARQRRRPAYNPNETLCICNPITREFVTLPGILMNKKESADGVHVVHGFGYHPLTNEYKVVRICYVGNKKSPSYKGRAEVYTIGSGRGWRIVGKTNLKPKHIGPTAGVCVNGAIHWVCDASANIMVFDLADEKFHVLRAPIKKIYDIRRIYVMKRRLCYEYYDHSDELVRLCFLEKNNEDEENINSYYVNAQYYKSWSWNTEFTMPLDMLNRLTLLIFSITKMGEILVITKDLHQVLRYPSQRTEILKTDIMFGGERRDWKVPLSHLNTFVSLEALGERNVKKFVAEIST